MSDSRGAKGKSPLWPYAALVLVVLGCGSSERPSESGKGRGRLISSEKAATYPQRQLEEIRQANAELEVLPVVRFGVECFKVRYETVDLDGSPTEATGMTCLPTGTSGPRPLLSVQHGTLVEDNVVPSEVAAGGMLYSAMLFASGGYVVSSADFLGLGGSPGMHPYLHAASEASSSLDMLRASKHLAAKQSVPTSDRLYLAGYSQGGHATMALFKELEENHAQELPVRAAMPMAGPYDLSRTSLDAALNQPAPPSSTYLAYVILGYQRAYGFLESTQGVFREPSRVEALFDGTHDFETIVAGLPATPEGLLTAEYFGALRDDANHPLRVLAARNDVYDWRPRAPTRLCHGEADDEVPFANAVLTARRMGELGADVAVVNAGSTLNHETAALPCDMEARRWFDALEQATP